MPHIINCTLPERDGSAVAAPCTHRRAVSAAQTPEAGRGSQALTSLIPPNFSAQPEQSRPLGTRSLAPVCTQAQDYRYNRAQDTGTIEHRITGKQSTGLQVQ